LTFELSLLLRLFSKAGGLLDSRLNEALGKYSPQLEMKKLIVDMNDLEKENLYSETSIRRV